MRRSCPKDEDESPPRQRRRVVSEGANAAAVQQSHKEEYTGAEDRRAGEADEAQQSKDEGQQQQLQPSQQDAEGVKEEWDDADDLDEEEEAEFDKEDEDEDEADSEPAGAGADDDYASGSGSVDGYDDEGEDGDDAEDDEDMFYEVYGGDDFDVCIDFFPSGPERADGALPESQPGDRQIAPGVYARDESDGHHCLYGLPLRNIPKLLRRIFQMQQQRGQLLWRSALVLTDQEWQYIQGVLRAERVQPLLQHGERVLKPLPDYGFPPRLRLHDASGRALQGPRVSGPNAKPWNRGRQYFSSFSEGDSSSFIWADGVRAMEPEAQESFNEHFAPGFFM